MYLKKIKKHLRGRLVHLSLIYAFYAFLCVKFLRKKERSLKLSKRTKINKTAFFMRNMF